MPSRSNARGLFCSIACSNGFSSLIRAKIEEGDLNCVSVFCEAAGPTPPHPTPGHPSLPPREPSMIASPLVVRWCLASTLLMSMRVCQATGDSIDFNREIRPILTEYCFHCHGPDAGQRSADLRLDLESEAKSLAIVAKNSADSPLMHRIRTAETDTVMPPLETGKVLSDEQKDLLGRWIDEGATYSAHWAFEPIRPTEQLIAELGDAHAEIPIENVSQGIDLFLEQPLTAAGLSYTPEVSQLQFIRRASFDLIGLPPTWNEVEAFVNDRSENARERLIDRLLESPRYGERWGRHWLDIARYADTHGGGAIGFTTFPFSYTYRDYVIRAFNANLPIDRFVLEQIAADQLGLREDDPTLAGLGFLTVGMQFRNDHDTIDDQIDVITRGLMGLTVTCARCHDHKFDAIPTSDYYALYATVSASQPCLELPVIGQAADPEADAAYRRQRADLERKLGDFVRDQSDVMRARLRMQVGLYLTEIAKGTGEFDVSMRFLSYRTDDIRPMVFNRWLAYLKEQTDQDPVFGPWVSMQSWGPLSAEEFSKRGDEYLKVLTAEIDSSGRTADKVHALGGEPPRWNSFIVDALVERKPKSLVDVAEVYGKVFTEEQRRWQHALIDAAAEAEVTGTLIPDDRPEHQVINSPTHRQLRHHLYARGTPFAIEDDQATILTNRTINDLINGKREAIHQLDLTSPGSPPRAMLMREDPHPTASYVFLRGNPLARGEQVPARFLTALSSTEIKKFPDGARRLALARAIVDSNNPLTARVLVNWTWQHHFGVGLVRTPDDFGTRGLPPTHPELLDYLADQFRRNGWSMKWLHRQILLTRAYRQGAVENETARRIDPENQLLWRMPRRRLDFEAMRDAMLAVSEELDVTMGGRPIDLIVSPAIPRRSVYGFINRDVVANLLSTFDTANPNACAAKRPETTVPQQTLFALNSEFIQDRAQRIAAVTQSFGEQGDATRVTALVQRVLGRNPSPEEIERAVRFLTEVRELGAVAAGAPAARTDPERAWVQLAHALLASNEFVFLD